MDTEFELITPRLKLRPWRDDDLEPLAALNADARVMEHFPSTLTRAESAAFLARQQESQRARGHSYFAAEQRGRVGVIGFIGLALQTYEAAHNPAVDIGWRLHPDLWGQGLATEGARRCLAFAFEDLGLLEVYSVAPEVNRPSVRVMEQLGMRRIGTFDHPLLAAHPRLQRCVCHVARHEPSSGA